jgi:hypothetical protein
VADGEAVVGTGRQLHLSRAAFDAIVPPGYTINPFDSSFTNPALTRTASVASPSIYAPRSAATNPATTAKASRRSS